MTGNPVGGWRNFARSLVSLLHKPAGERGVTYARRIHHAPETGHRLPALWALVAPNSRGNSGGPGWDLSTVCSCVNKTAQGPLSILGPGRQG